MARIPRDDDEARPTGAEGSPTASGGAAATLAGALSCTAVASIATICLI